MNFLACGVNLASSSVAQGLHSASIPGILALDLCPSDTNKILTGKGSSSACRGLTCVTESLCVPGSGSLCACFWGQRWRRGARGILWAQGKAAGDGGCQEKWVNLVLVATDASLTTSCFVFQAGLIKTSSSLTRARSRSWPRSRVTPRRSPASSSTHLRCA